MKRYILFTTVDLESSGGLEDAKGLFTSLRKAMEAGLKEKDYIHQIEILDTQTGVVHRCRTKYGRSPEWKTYLLSESLK